MYVLKRMIAYAIDSMLIVSPLSFLVFRHTHAVRESIPEGFHLLPGIGLNVLSLGLPVLLLGILSGLTGRTPGKFLMFLRVEDHAGDPPGIAQGIVREIIKAVCLGFFFGTIWALAGLVSRKETFYDQWLDLRVEDLRPTGLTPTQKNFRKYMREQARKQRR